MTTSLLNEHGGGSGKVALITGASRGLGKALARRLSDLGWALIVDGRNARALHNASAGLREHSHQDRAAGRQEQEVSVEPFLTAIAGDVTDPAHLQELARVAQDAGGLDLLINNAGALGPSPQPALLEYPLDVLEWVFRTNVMAPLALLQAVKGALKPGACIINVTSDAAVEAYPGWGGYGASKAALEQLSAVLAQENPGLRLYWVDPGDMRTQMHQDAFPGEDISDRPLPEESVDGFLALISGERPSGRYRVRELLP